MIQILETKNYLVTLCFASQIGFEKSENQDSIRFDANADRFALSICDGLGSAPLSAQGSAEAARIMVSQLLDGSFEKGSFQNEWRQRFPENPQKYNTTAKFILLSEGEIRLGGVGDGIIVVHSNGKTAEFTSRGDFSNQTSCVFDLSYNDNFLDKKRPLTTPTVAMISSDGFSEDIKEDGLEMLMNTAFDSLQSAKLREEFDFSLNELLRNWPNPTNGDDKTVAFIMVEDKHE